MNRLKNVLMWIVIFSVVGLLAVNVFLYLTVDQRSHDNQKRGAESYNELVELRGTLEERLTRLEAALNSVSVKNGVDGRDGSDGKDGTNGADGAAGENGKDGVDGRDGADGKDAPVLAIRCNANKNRWEERYFSNGEWSLWRLLNGALIPCTIPQE